MGVAALVLGILAVTTFWIPFVGWLGVLLGLVAAVLGILGLVKGNKGLGIVGLVLGGVALIGGLVIQIGVIVATDAALDAGQDYLDQMKQAQPTTAEAPDPTPFAQ